MTRKPKKNRFVAEEGDMICTSPHMGKATWDLIPQEARERLSALGWRDGIRPDPVYPPDYIERLTQSGASMEKDQWDHLPEEFRVALKAAGYVDGISPSDQCPHMGLVGWCQLSQASQDRLEALGWRDGINPDPVYPPDYVNLLIRTRSILEKDQWDHLPKEFRKTLRAAGYVDGFPPDPPKSKKKK